MRNRLIIRKTFTWTLDGLHRYRCTSACARTCMRMCEGLGQHRNLNVCWFSPPVCSWLSNHEFLSATIKITKDVYLSAKTCQLTTEPTAQSSVWPAGPCNFPARGLEPVRPSAMMSLPISSLCLNDRPFICASALSSDTTLMALTSCKLRQLAVWERERACVGVWAC